MYISPSNRWLPAAALEPRENDPNLSLREDYDAVVAGLPLSQATDQAVIWHDRVVSACGFPSYFEPDDASIL